MNPKTAATLGFELAWRQGDISKEKMYIQRIMQEYAKNKTGSSAPASIHYGQENSRELAVREIIYHCIKLIAGQGNVLSAAGYLRRR